MKIFILALVIMTGSMAMADQFDETAAAVEDHVATDTGSVDASSTAPSVSDANATAENAPGDQKALTNQFDYQGGD